MNRTALLALALAATCGVPIAHAQQMRRAGGTERQGFWIGFGLGAGSVGFDCTGCGNDRNSGMSGYLRLGGTISPQFLLGGETNGFVGSQNGWDQQVSVASVVALWYPSRTGRFFLKVGLGGMYYTETDGVDEYTASGPSFSLGVGYDIRAGNRFSITPFLNSIVTSGSKVEYNGVSATDDVNPNLVQIGVGLTWH